MRPDDGAAGGRKFRLGPWIASMILLTATLVGAPRTASATDQDPPESTIDSLGDTLSAWQDETPADMAEVAGPYERVALDVTGMT